VSVSLPWLLDGIVPIAAPAIPIADLALDSHDVRPGSLFFALAGGRRHGLEFAREAAQRGAVAVLWEPGAPAAAPELPSGVFAAPVANLRGALGRIADRFYGWPSQGLRICGITGTNGKTTCAYLLAQCLERLGSPSAYIGTLGLGRVSALREATHTTPDVIRLHRVLAELKSDGVRAVAIEVSSHALDQGRVDGVHFHSAAFTNLTRDHLDYHETMEAYAEAKARLFARPELAHRIFNVGDEFGRRLAERFAGAAAATVVWVGAGALAWLAPQWLQVTTLRAERGGLALELNGSMGPLRLHSTLIGRFNAENLAVVLGCLIGFGIPPEDAAAALGACGAAPGRMEVVPAGRSDQPLAVVDYAHTPDALAKALNALREHCRGLLWCVFGCGGDRDAGKRAIMGGVVDELADRIIVTDDNPRSESPAAITAAIVAGIGAGRARVIHDRGEAIGTALREAGAADVVLIAGKGHEEYQIYGTERRAFSDRREAERHLGVAA
jgi:UDP-N-acetylmuramoyl-L-alanyl-D-glutamate--2,6-diaminopimelate ligase